MGRPSELMIAQVSIGVFLLVIIRSLGDFFRLQYLHGDGKVTPYVADTLFTAVALAVTVTSYFAGLGRIPIALVAATVILLFGYRIAVMGRCSMGSARIRTTARGDAHESNFSDRLMRRIPGHSLRASRVGAGVQPAPSDQRISVGPLWLVDVARVLLSGSGFAGSLRSSKAGRSCKARTLGAWGLFIIGVAYFCAGMFPPDPKWFVGSLLHGLGGLVVIFGSPMVFTLVSKGFIRNETSATIVRLLICTAALTWLSLVLFYGSIVAFGGAPRSGSFMVGWTNRILITTFVLWLLVAAFHVRSRSR